MSIGDMVGERLREVESDDEIEPYEDPWYFQHIIKAISGGTYDRSKKYVKRFHPSGTGGCKRQMFFDYLGFPCPSADLQGQMRMDQGTAVHEKWEGYWRKSGLPVILEQRFEIDDPIPLSGKPDVIVTNPENLEQYLIEFKSKDQRAMQWMKKPNEPHIWQWNQYAFMTEVHKGWIHYEGLNEQDWKVFPMIFDEDWWNGFVKHIQEILLYAYCRHCPPRTWCKTVKSGAGKYCGFKPICFELPAEGGILP